MPRYFYKRSLVLSFFLLSAAGCAFLFRSPIPSVPDEPRDGFYRGVFHVHSSFSHDSKASLERIHRAAEKEHFDFVVVTDHKTLAGRAAYAEKNLRPPPLFIFGEEITAPDGHMIALGISKAPPRTLSSQQFIDWIHAGKGFAILSHPAGKRTPWRNFKVKDYDGIEIYNFPHSFYPNKNPFKIAANFVFLLPSAFLKFQDVPRRPLELWDEKLSERPVAGFGAVDAHIHLKIFGWAPENFSLYLESVTTYVRAGKLEEGDIVEALGRGRSFVALEAHGHARGFSFTASSENQTYQMGDTIARGSAPIRFSIKSPAPAEIRLIYNGKILRTINGTEMSAPGEGEGSYRVEVFRGKKTWILSNPIYIKKTADQTPI